MQDAQRDLDGVATRLASEHPATNTERGVRVMSLTENYLGSTAALLRALFAAVLLFLLITCANVTSLQLVRAAARQREIALRIALGAERGRLVRQLLTEGVVLAAVGGVAGAAVATWGVAAASAWIPEGLLPPYVRVGVDARALLFGMGLALTVGTLCGLVPAVLSSRQDLTDALKAGARSAGAGLGRIRRLGPQQVLVAAEVALALVLLVGAGLLLRSLGNQLAVAPGFRPAGVLAARITLPAERYPAAERAAFAAQLAERLGALPSVTAASVSSDLPLTGNTSAARLIVEGGDPEGLRYYRHAVVPSFFTTLGIPIVRGRAFTAQDRLDTPRVVIVSAATAKRLWPGQDPIGQHVRLGSGANGRATVVGVAGDVRFRDLTTNLSAPGSEPDVYMPFAQRTDRDVEIAVRSGTAALPPAAMLRDAVAAIDPQLAVYAVRPLADRLRQQSATARFGSLVLGGFSAAAVVLAAIGIYGVIAFAVGLSRREIAIRIALGATRGSVSGLIVRNGMTLVLAGVVLGLAGSSLATRALAAQLFGVTPADPVTFALVTTLVVLVALLASYAPARRAARLDPQVALRAE
jgi:putative ABC transport system permease protein